MILAILLFVVAFVVVAMMLSRQSKSAKKHAIDDLKAEKESVGTFDIFELVESETNALGLLEIEGAQGIEHAVLLKVWSDSNEIVESCVGREYLRYVVAGGITPAAATEDDVELECSNTTISEPREAAGQEPDE